MGSDSWWRELWQNMQTLLQRCHTWATHKQVSSPYLKVIPYTSLAIINKPPKWTRVESLLWDSCACSYPHSLTGCITFTYLLLPCFVVMAEVGCLGSHVTDFWAADLASLNPNFDDFWSSPLHGSSLSYSSLLVCTHYTRNEQCFKSKTSHQDKTLNRQTQ